MATDQAMTERATLPAINLLGIDVHRITQYQCIDHIIRCIDHGSGGWVVTPNLDILRRCIRDEEFAALVREADIVVADGMPLVWASRLQRTPLPERVAGSSLLVPLAQAAAKAKRSIFFLGGDPGTAEAAAARLKEHTPELRVAGVHSPPVGFEHDEGEMERIKTYLSSSIPDIVLVALGSPKQERLITQLRSVLPAAWWLGIGISFSFLSGDVRRAPQWMQRAGLEWVSRLIQEPRRLARRYLIDGLPFATRLMTVSLLRGLTQSAQPAEAEHLNPKAQNRA